MADPILVLCETCGSEGRIIVRCMAYEPGCATPHHHGERDEGECPDCEGTGYALIEGEPITLEDLEEYGG